jgi:hypothetical protein
VQLDVMRLPEVAHHQSPAVEVAEHKWAFQQRKFAARLNSA